jgi:transcription elongation factor GreA-like protein
MLPKKRQRMNIVSKTARKEIVEALRARYGKATKLEKSLILGEFTAV